MVTAIDGDGGEACPGVWLPVECAGTLGPHPQLSAAASTWEPHGGLQPLACPRWAILHIFT